MVYLACSTRCPDFREGEANASVLHELGDEVIVVQGRDLGHGLDAVGTQGADPGVGLDDVLGTP